MIGPSTEIAAGNGMILTAGAIDTHVHVVDPASMVEALGAGTTTVVGGGTGPTEGSKATLATPGSWWTQKMLESMEPWPVNVLFLGRGNTVSQAALAALGDPNASVPTPQPVLPRLGFNAQSPTAASTSVGFVSQAALDDGLAERLQLRRRLVAPQNVRGRAKADLPENTALPHIEVDPATYSVTVGGELIEHEPATELPMTQRYFLF